MIEKREQELSSKFGNLVLRCTSEKVNPEQIIPCTPGELTGYEEPLIQNLKGLPGMRSFTLLH